MEKTRPQDKWDQKAGLIAKTFKVNSEIVKEFQEVCKKEGIAMGTQLNIMMKEYVAKNR